MFEWYTARETVAWWQKSKEWFIERAKSIYMKWWLFGLSFTESSVFIIPPDPLLIALTLATSKKWFSYALITTGASIAGAIFGYMLGYFFFDSIGYSIISVYGVESQFEQVKVLFNESSFVVILAAAFTPIPFKVFVLTAGFLQSSFWLFLLATILGRAGRYVGIAYGVSVLGEYGVILIKKYSTVLTFGTIVVLLLYFIFKFFFIY